MEWINDEVCKWDTQMLHFDDWNEVVMDKFIKFPSIEKLTHFIYSWTELFIINIDFH